MISLENEINILPLSVLVSFFLRDCKRYLKGRSLFLLVEGKVFRNGILTLIKTEIFK